MSNSHEPRPITAAELLPLAVAAESVDHGFAPTESAIGKCPTCGLDVVSGDSFERPYTLDLYWVANPCGCFFSVSDETLDELRQGLDNRVGEAGGLSA
ncbi:hypothetical protein ACFYPN_16325 [Streptomyces sp. NPDC005576]|uniref:hypothetical protein n=1 Tax=Streptomyces sp. NPDC005576 TaxID=3364726 RepID=UPI00368806B2